MTRSESDPEPITNGDEDACLNSPLRQLITPKLSLCAKAIGDMIIYSVMIYKSLKITNNPLIVNFQLTYLP